MSHEPIKRQPKNSIIDHIQTHSFGERRAAPYGAGQALRAATLQCDLPAIARCCAVVEKQHIFSRMRLAAFGKHIRRCYQAPAPRRYPRPLLIFEPRKRFVDYLGRLAGTVMRRDGTLSVIKSSHNNISFVFPFWQHAVVAANKLTWPQTTAEITICQH